MLDTPAVGLRRRGVLACQPDTPAGGIRRRALLTCHSVALGLASLQPPVVESAGASVKLALEPR